MGAVWEAIDWRRVKFVNLFMFAEFAKRLGFEGDVCVPWGVPWPVWFTPQLCCAACERGPPCARTLQAGR